MAEVVGTGVRAVRRPRRRAGTTAGASCASRSRARSRRRCARSPARRARGAARGRLGSGSRSRTARGRRFFNDLTRPSETACSMTSVRSRTWRHSSASASPGRRPAYARRTRRAGSRPRATNAARIASICSGSAMTAARDVRCPRLPCRSHGVAIDELPLDGTREDAAEHRVRLADRLDARAGRLALRAEAGDRERRDVAQAHRPQVRSRVLLPDPPVGAQRRRLELRLGVERPPLLDERGERRTALTDQPHARA